MNPTPAAWALAALLALPAAGLAQEVDGRLSADVQRAVRAASQLTIFDDVNADLAGDGHVVLHGKVTAPAKRRDVEARVAAVRGVQAVRNHIDVLPASRSDDELRQRVARAIYGNPSFWRYASMTSPPIHIVVERGHVTLTGVVGSHVERALARSLATGQGEVSVTNALRTDGEIAVKLGARRSGPSN
jgi:osmotically-inducible protein OsmY